MAAYLYISFQCRQLLVVQFKVNSRSLASWLELVPVPHADIPRNNIRTMKKMFMSMHLIVFFSSGIASLPTDLCILDRFADRALLPLLFLFLPNLAWAHSSHRLSVWLVVCGGTITGCVTLWSTILLLQAGHWFHQYGNNSWS